MLYDGACREGADGALEWCCVGREYLSVSEGEREGGREGIRERCIVMMN